MESCYRAPSSGKKGEWAHHRPAQFQPHTCVHNTCVPVSRNWQMAQNAAMQERAERERGQHLHDDASYGLCRAPQRRHQRGCNGCNSHSQCSDDGNHHARYCTSLRHDLSGVAEPRGHCKCNCPLLYTDTSLLLQALVVGFSHIFHIMHVCGRRQGAKAVASSTDKATLEGIGDQPSEMEGEMLSTCSRTLRPYTSLRINRIRGNNFGFH
jgi:hypothetical protein